MQLRQTTSKKEIRSPIDSGHLTWEWRLRVSDVTLRVCVSVYLPRFDEIHRKLPD